MPHPTLPLLVLAAGCKVEVAIPQGELDALAEDVCSVGHPTARYEGARLVGFKAGWLSAERYVDVGIDYKGVMARKVKTLTVRFHVDSLDPCQVHTEVLSDTGTNPPVLLDNQVASPLVGQRICRAFD